MPAHPHQTNVIGQVGCAVLTVSDTRTPETNVGGRLVRELLEQAGHVVVVSQIIPDEPQEVAARVVELVDLPECRAVLLTGGTGLAARDTTVEALSGLFTRRLDGFGELFRMLSYQEVGARAMLSRAVAGVRHTTAIFAMPGSPAAVRLAMTKLIVPQLGHLAWLLEPQTKPNAPRSG